MPAAMLTPDQAPPEDYYQNNCRTAFTFVLKHYGDLLDAETYTHVNTFLELSDDGQRLFARILTRKPLLRVDALSYSEVSDLDAAVAELNADGLVRLNGVVPGDALLALLRKAEVLDLDAQVGLTHGKSVTKTGLVQSWLSRYSDAQIARRVAPHCCWLCVAQPSVWGLVRLLYFGGSQQDWSAFVIRDLGMVHYEPVAMNTRLHKNHAALQADLSMRRLSHLSHRLDEYPSLAPALANLLQAPVQERHTEMRRTRTLLRVGAWLERQGEVDQAVQVYAAAKQHPARERIVRVLAKHDREHEAQLWLERIKASPGCAEEQQFLQRFGKRQAGYQPPVTIVDIEHARADIEQQALELILAEHTGSEAWGAHVENSLVRSLTGLMYWPVLFADVAGAFTNPFQFGPNDLYSEDFCALRSQQITELEMTLENDVSLAAHLRDMATGKQGVANSLVNWGLLETMTIDEILDAMPLEHIRALCAFMLRNLHQRRAGLPDLLVVYGTNNYEFVEVKGPTDQLQPGQRVWLKQFAEMGIPARVMKLRLAP